MAVVVYQCNVCKRKKQFLLNRQGLETVGHCTITAGCRGELYQTELLRDFQRTQRPEPVEGLLDWIPRKVLHNHKQTITNNQWVIEHNLNTFPAVNVFVDRPDPDTGEEQRVEIIPQDIITVDENTVRINFDRRESGIAQLVARQTDPQRRNSETKPSNRPQPTTRVEQPQGPIQLTNQGELTIATLINAFDEAQQIDFDVTFTPTNGAPITVTYTFDTQPTIKSPWGDADKIILKGKTYKVRSVNVIPQIVNNFVPTGSTFTFDNVTVSGTTRNIQKNQVLILTASEPFSNFDKNFRQFIDVTSVTQDKNTFSFFFDTSELFARNNIVENIFLPIRLL